jgi:diapolycopene oxygenase
MSTSSTFDAVVIGGGLAGLAACVELAGKGLSVCVVETNRHLGGKMNVMTVPHPDKARNPALADFKFDMGPTIITLPQVLRGIITRTGRKVDDYVTLVDLDPQWRCFFDDGTVIDLRKSVEAMRAQFDQKFPGTGAGEGYAKFIDYSRRMFRLSERVFFYKDVGGATDLMRRSPVGDPKLLGDVLAMRMHSTMAATAHKMISERHVQQLVEHFLQYVGSSPFMAPAILSLIAAAQVDHGCWYPMGGTREVARSLARIADELGVHAELGATVRRVIVNGQRAVGVEIETAGGQKKTIRADAVVSNCDVQRTFRDLLDTPRAKSRGQWIAKNYTPACSGLVLYLGLSRQYTHLAHHDFLFSKDSTEEFADIYTRGVPARDPTLYLAVPSRTDPLQAPPGCESLYVLIHTPYLRPGHEWLLPDGSPGKTLRDYRPVVIEKLKRCGMEDLEKHILVEKYLTPTQIDRMYNAEGGAIYGLASHGKLGGGFKPRNRSQVLDNLYLAGGSANPGPGVPMVLMSGVTAAHCVLEDLGQTPAPPEMTPVVSVGAGVRSPAGAR